MSEEEANSDESKFRLNKKQSKRSFERLIEDKDLEAAHEMTRAQSEFVVAFMAGIAPEDANPNNFSLSREQLRIAAREMRAAEMESAGYGDIDSAENGDIKPGNVSFSNDVPVSPNDYKASELIEMCQEIGVSYQGTKDKMADNINTWFHENQEKSEDETEEESEDGNEAEWTADEMMELTWDELEAEFQISRDDYQNKEEFVSKFLA